MIEASQRGEGLAHLSAGQVYAAVTLAMTPEQLQRPLAAHIQLLLSKVEREARDRFYSDVAEGDADEIIRRTFDPNMPAFCRAPMRHMLDEEMERHFPNLKPDGVNDKGEHVFSLTNIARNLGTTEEALLDMAEEKDVTDQLGTGPIHKVH